MVALQNTINETAEKSYDAFLTYRTFSAQKRKEFLNAISKELYNLGDELIETASQETHLPIARFIGERERTCNHFISFGEYIAEGSYVEAVIDSAIEERIPTRKPDIRKMLLPMGPVVVFGASNFPLAYSAPGGDTASALAVGCSVIVKGHPSHPKTSALVQRAIHAACEKNHIPKEVFILVQDDSYEAGRLLVIHPKVSSVGFTGSLKGGRAIYDYAQSRKNPIPVFSEMGSVNPVILMPNKLKKETEQIAKILSKSITMGVGQFCTNPGIILAIHSEELNQFKQILAEYLAKTPAFPMLNEGIHQNFIEGIEQVSLVKEITFDIAHNKMENLKTGPVLASVQGKDFIKHPRLREEVFGPFSLIIECSDLDELHNIWRTFEGQLTTTFMVHEEDMEVVKTFMSDAEHMAGRIVFNFEPTGVEVGHATVHGGPYPATTDSRFTSVGMEAVKRWLRPVCYQDCPESLLPLSLRDSNPLKIWRKVNGTFCK